MIYQIILKSKNSFTIYNAETGQIVRTQSVDGNIIGAPIVTGDSGVIVVQKGITHKSYVYNLKNGSVKKIFNV